MSKACDRVKKQLSPYIDNVLSREEKAMVEQELSECEECKNEAAFLNGIIKMAKELPTLEVTDSFREGLHERLLQEQQAPKHVKRFNWQPASALVAAAAVFAFSVITLNSLPQHPELTSEVQTEQNFEKQEPVEADSASITTAEASELVFEPVKKTEPQPKKQEAVKTVVPEQPVPIQEQTTKEQPVQEQAKETVGGALETASVLEDGANFPAAVSEASETDALPVLEDNAAPLMKASGGGSSARAVLPKADCVKVHYYFEQGSIEAATELLKSYPQRDGAFILSSEEQKALHRELTALTGYQSFDIEQEMTDAATEMHIVLRVGD